VDKNHGDFASSVWLAEKQSAANMFVGRKEVEAAQRPEGRLVERISAMGSEVRFERNGGIAHGSG